MDDENGLYGRYEGLIMKSIAFIMAFAAFYIAGHFGVMLVRGY